MLNRINDEKIGTVKLSYTIGVKDSMAVISNEAVKMYRKVILEFIENTIIKVDNKNAKDPSRVLLLAVFNTPYLIPNIAAAESEIIVISIDVITIFLLKKNKIIKKAIIIYELPRGLLYSYFLMKVPNILLKTFQIVELLFFMSSK